MRGKSIIEVLLVFLLGYLFFWTYRTTELAMLERSILGWSYIAVSVMVLIPISILLLARRNFEPYGLTFRGWRYNLDVGLTCYLVLLIPYSPIVLSWMFGITYDEITQSIISATAGIAALLIILLILRRREASSRATSAQPPSSKLNLTILVALLLLPIFLGLYLGRLTIKVVSTVVWQFFFSGFGEEIQYRGYFQSRINQEFGHPFSFLGASFGAGLIIASLLFALAHVLNPFSPFEGRFDLDWWWGFRAFFAGLFFGFIRERTESVVAASIAHGLPDAVGEALARLLSLSL